MTTSLRSEELKNLLTKIYRKGATGFVSITVQDGTRSVYGTLQVSQGQLLSAQFKNVTGRNALERMFELESPSISFASSNVNSPKDADIPKITDVIDLSHAPVQTKRRVKRQTQSQKAQSQTGSGVAARGAGAQDPDRKGLSVRSKMLLLFSVLPMLVLLGLGVFYISQIGQMASVLTEDADAIISSLAEDTIALHAQEVAAEASRFLAANPGLTQEALQNNPVFKEIAVRPIGETGYSVLMEAPFTANDSNNVWWVHPNDALIGQELGSLAPALGENFPQLNALISGITANPQGKVTGFYDWLEPDGSIREKFLATTRVAGTPYFIASTTYIDEFTQPTAELQEKSARIVNQTQLFVIIATTLAMLFTLFSVALYGNRLSRKIQAISDVADAISLGNLGVTIEGKERGDELGSLARAIERLRVSVKVMFTELRSQQGS